jgi:bifunctional non-homologous end joining protein LigD
MGLETYRKKRDFSRTREPRGRQKRRTGNSFVVQKHDATRLHYDFRLELDGVLLSWAVPKGPSLDPDVKRLAMMTEDHPIEYGEFEGTIPEGEYGGGTVLLWDRGTWQPEGDAQDMLKRGRLTFDLHGEKLRGRFHLVRSSSRLNGGKKKDAGKSWLLFKGKDDAALPGTDAQLLEQRPESVASGRDLSDIAADPDHVWASKKKTRSHPSGTGAGSGRARAAAARRTAAPVTKLAEHDGAKRAALPDFIEPQLATLVNDAPQGDDWLHEIKLDGYRILARVERGKVQLDSRRGHDWSARLPSLASALGRLPVQSALIDGELVVLNERGLSDFQLLQNSLQNGRDARCVYYAFDLLYLDGFDLRALPLHQRKELLRSTLEAAEQPRLRFSDHIRGSGPAFFQQACKQGLEGILCKQADAPYVSGRKRSWLKVKCMQEQELVVGGFTRPAGSRQHLGALLLGVREGGELQYAGKVGTGFTQDSLAELVRRLKPLEQEEPPFANPPRGAEARGVHWVRPELVAQVSFVERTRDGRIRHASFHGLRDDKPSAEVKLEQPEPSARPKRKGAKKTTAKETVVQAAAARKPARNAAKSTRNAAKPTSKAQAASSPAIELDTSRLEITHPERVLYPDQGLTKRDLLLHYARVARWMLPHVVQRPLMLVRCPEGAGAGCFHQKHPSQGMPRAVQRVTVPQKKGPEENLMIADVEGLLGLVQMGALEIHSWGCRAQQLECPDQLVFDLDPDEGLAWPRVLEAAQLLREQLEARGLTPFLRSTGGKGLHLVVPVEPKTPWEEAKAFTQRIAEQLAQAEPAKYVATMTKSKRKGKIFIDYFRNGRGATAVCSYSTRARPGAPVAVPIAWNELEQLRPGAFHVQNLQQRLEGLRKDPWAGFDDARARIPKK